MIAPTWFSRGGWRGLVGVGLLGDDLGGQLDTLVADRDLGGWAAHDRGDLVACLSAERAADLAKPSRPSRRFGGHLRNAIGRVVRS